MAIKFEDKGEGDKAVRPKPAKVAAPEPAVEGGEAAGQLPFAKPVRADKKRKGR